MGDLDTVCRRIRKDNTMFLFLNPEEPIDVVPANGMGESPFRTSLRFLTWYIGRVSGERTAGLFPAAAMLRLRSLGMITNRS